MKVLHVISGLNVGGAERMLQKLLIHLDSSRFQNSVVSMTGPGPLTEELRHLNLTPTDLGMSRNIPDPRAIYRLRSIITRERPSIVQTWMYHADLLGGIANLLNKDVRVVWNIRQSKFDKKSTKRTTLWTARACARLSRRLPDSIICCSEAARKAHADIGYDQTRMTVIRNGVDLNEFKPDPVSARSVREKIGVDDGVPLIGLVARFDPIKDHATFLKAAVAVRESYPDVQFVLCGEGVTRANPSFMELVDDSIRDALHLLGPVSDVSGVTAALDVATSSSIAEGFSNTIIEAMACGVPCVATAVGDAVDVIGDTGWTVPPQDTQALAEALKKAAGLSRERLRALGRSARLRASECFSLAQAVQAYEQLYTDVREFRRH